MRPLLAALLVSLALVATSGTAHADGPKWTKEQTETIRLIYTYAEFYGVTEADTALMLRIAYRESGFTNAVGDGGRSVGPFQLYDRGIYLSSPYYQEYGLAGRYNVEVNVATASWAFNRGMQSHWRPDLCVRWLKDVPPDPRKGGAP